MAITWFQLCIKIKSALRICKVLVVTVGGDEED